MMFPFSDVRPVQKNFMQDIKNAVETKRHLVAHAPTGLGKTAATLAPCLDYALANGKVVFFLTPRHSQHQIAIETLRLMREKSEKKFTVTDLIGKKWLCSVSGIDELTNSEFNDYCHAMLKEERCNFYNNTKTKHRTLTAQAYKLISILNEKQPLHAEEAKDICEDYCCTYEMLMELAKKSNIVVADYFHIFSGLRGAVLTRMNKKLEDVIIIVDEAHNLPHRVRDMMSKRMTTFSLKYAEKEAKAFGFTGIAEVPRKLNLILEELRRKKLKNDEEMLIEKELFTALVENQLGSIDEITGDLLSAGEHVKEEKKKSFISKIAEFLDAWTGDDIGYTRIISKGLSKTNKSFTSISYSCLDPSLITKSIIEGTHSTILMSGTLYPTEMYRDLLGMDHARTDMFSYKSPFPKTNRLNVIMPQLTTRYTTRNQENYIKISSAVITCSNAIKGNVAVFFPSYQIRDIIFDLSSKAIKKEIMIESQGATKRERRILYDNFVHAHEKGAVLMGVQSGSFSEGVDMPGSYLNGVVVVGVPLEKPDLTTKELIDYYDYKFKRGWDYGYLYPAMIRSIQAAGRCIRSESDRGVCVFIDERFLWGNYKKVFPSEMEFLVSTQPEKSIKEFFEKG
jgi:DNA excision repair protein ERCC-2